MEIVPYSSNLKIRNLESLSRGTGARYLECIRGEGEDLVAKQWRRSVPSSYDVLVDFQYGKSLQMKALRMKYRKKGDWAVDVPAGYAVRLRPYAASIGKLTGDRHKDKEILLRLAGRATFSEEESPNVVSKLREFGISVER